MRRRYAVGGLLVAAAAVLLAVPGSALADATDLESLKQLGVNEFQHAVVSIGQNLEASVLTILNLSQMGNKDIWAKTMNVMGPAGMLYGSYEMKRPDVASGFETNQKAFRRSRANSIEGGTTEVMKNIIAERVLGLPRLR